MSIARPVGSRMIVSLPALPREDLLEAELEPREAAVVRSRVSEHL